MCFSVSQLFVSQIGHTVEGGSNKGILGKKALLKCCYGAGAHMAGGKAAQILPNAPPPDQSHHYIHGAPSIWARDDLLL